MEKEEEIYLVARYLVEDNNQDYIEFDLKRPNSMGVVRTIFRKLVGKYIIMSEIEEEQMFFDLSRVWILS